MNNNSDLIICTHSGTFHVDEILACALLTHLPRFANAKILRSRDPQAIEKATIVVDVGGIYDPLKHRYDHHQASFQETFGSSLENKISTENKIFTENKISTENKIFNNNNNKIKLSSAGLIYKHFGKEIVANIVAPFIFQAQSISGGTGFTTAQVVDAIDSIYQMIYVRFIQELDAHDNGIKKYATEPPEALFATGASDLPNRIRRLNPSWMEVQTSSADRDYRFKIGMEWAWTDFRSIAEDCTANYLSGNIVKHAFMVAKRLGSRVMELPQWMPYENHLQTCEGGEEKNTSDEKMLFLVYPDLATSIAKPTWMVRALAISPGSFTSRLPFPKSWCGLSDLALQKECGVNDAVFVHANGFLAGAQSLTGARMLAAFTMIPKQ